MKITIKCENCDKDFERDSREIKRSLKKGRKQFCSRQCAGKNRHDQLDPYKGKFDLTKYAGNRKDKYSGFREHVRRIKNREKEISIDIDYLLEVWENQNGICPYTGISLVHPSFKNINCKIKTASLDRINSSKGYIKDNLQFVSIAINNMKSSMSHEQTIELCKIITEKWHNYR